MSYAEVKTAYDEIKAEYDALKARSERLDFEIENCGFWHSQGHWPDGKAVLMCMSEEPAEIDEDAEVLRMKEEMPGMEEKIPALKAEIVEKEAAYAAEDEKQKQAALERHNAGIAD